ncbi:spore coat U domain-containing protein [Sphingopyxis granuli]|uniref:Csu type fimbrial protein n=1 Tax=Sphingopyxis granuli TaxID=267128 RepID=UPI001F53B58C|nr:spore coat U domain-containing protein [Sphingopyxis granuli]UNK79785.1 spore coat U domain-containing protein [Sphingopyxis granuli]
MSATIVAGCEINGALATNGQSIGTYGTVDFGTHAALSTETVTAAILPDAGLTLACTPDVLLTVTLGGGLNNGATRNMKAAGSNALQPYTLHRDAGLSQEYAVDQPYAVTFDDPEAIILPVYGQAPLSGDKPPDIYSDTVLITLSW